MRLSDEEWSQVTSRAAEAGLALGAWIGEVVVEASAGHRVSALLPDLLRLHSDVLRIDDLSPAGELRGLVRRLEVAVDAVVAEIERGRQ